LGALVNSSSNAAHDDYYQRYGYGYTPSSADPSKE
jgi:hypothetical protein